MEEKDNFLDEYLSRGFGKVKMADLEVMIFHYLKKEKKIKLVSDDKNDLSAMDISLSLSLPMTKVKDLMYKESLMYDAHDEPSLKNKIKKLQLKSVSFEGEGKWILIITDKFVREYVTNYLLTNNKSVKSDFVRDNLVLDYDGIIFLCDYAYDDDNEISDIKKCLTWEMIKESGKEILSDVTNGLISSNIIDAVKSLANQFIKK